MKESISENDVFLDNSSIVQVLPVKSKYGNNKGDALVITNQSGNTVTKDILLLVGADGTTTSQIHNPGDVSPMGSTSADYPPTSWDGRYVIHGTAVYEQYSHNWVGCYYRPTGAYFSYRKYKACTVGSIWIKYICDGMDYSYPGFTPLGGDEIVNVITVVRTNPAEGTTYSKSQPYATDRVIMTGSGSPMVGQFLTFWALVDGKEDTYTVTL